MFHRPPRFSTLFLAFAPLFVHRSRRHAEVLMSGAILAPGRRTVTSILRITGLARERRFVNYHRVLNRAVWCLKAASRLLLGLLVSAFVPSGPVVLGIDDTIERRRGGRIAAKGTGSHRASAMGARLPRSRPVPPWALRQGKRPALAQPHAAGADPVGRAHLGTAVTDRTDALGAWLPGEWAAAQEAHGLGKAAGAVGLLLATPAQAGGRGR